MFIYVLSRHLQCLFVNKCAIMIHHVKTWLPITAKVALAVQVPGAFSAVRLRRDQSETGFRFHGSLDYPHLTCRAFKTDACGLPFRNKQMEDADDEEVERIHIIGMRSMCIVYVRALVGW